MAGLAAGDIRVGTAGVLDADVAAILARAAELDLPSLPSLGPEEARREFRRRLARSNPPAPQDLAVRDVAAAGSGGPLRLRLYRPEAASGGALLYFHGGGFVLGDLETADPICRLVAARTGSAVVALDYRLAPEHPYPAAVEDALAALRWLEAGPPELGGRPTVLGVAGDSAGGTLAAVAALHARDRGIDLRRQILIYPAVDQGGAYPSRVHLAQGYLLTADDIAWFNRQYFGECGGAVLDTSASPLRSVSHAGTAPALVLTAGFDPLADEGRAYAARLAACGVPVRHVCLHGAIHGCLGLARFLECGRRALDEITEAWASALS